MHLDGARFANAVAHHGCAPADLTSRAGVDVLTFGGTKAGLAFGEAVVFFRLDLAQDFEYRLKQSGHLASKMRFISAQWLGLLGNDRWLQRSAHANRMASLLRGRLECIEGVQLLFPTQANAVYAKIPPVVTQTLRERGWRFYDDVGPPGGARLMCSWDTVPEDVHGFASDLAQLMGQTV
jgi:threonine aldolase